MPGDLPQVRFNGRSWRVIGLLDEALADRIRDINGESLAMVDYLRSGFSSNVSGELEEEGEAYHLSWDELLIVPYEVRFAVEAETRSVAIKLPEGTDQNRFFRDLAIRIKQPFFASFGGEPLFVTTRQTFDVGGLAKVILPVILCVLIVMNTMMGTVEERKGEVGMLGSIGLSPRQISFLLLSEASVYSVLGIIFGVFAGLLFANLIPVFNGLLGTSFLSEVSFNFTSLVSMSLGLLTGVIVLLATLIPASRAARLAAPSGMASWRLPPPDADGRIRFELPFTLTRGNAVGMLAFIRQFLFNHSDPTSQDFNARDITESRGEADEAGIEPLELRSLLWLAPYDLDVAQQFTMRIGSTPSEGIYAVTLEIERTTGAEEAWLRTNYNFLNLIRRQFLIWRNLSPELRERYIDQGRRLIQGETVDMA
jgi:hypothetical protein